MPAIRAGLKRDARVDCIYTSGPPHSVHIVGLALRQLTGARWVAEFRDPWTDNAEKSRNVRSAASDFLERQLEAMCLRRADRIIALTESAASAFATRIRGNPEKVLTVRSGVEVFARDVPPRPATTPIRIAYFGNLYLQRDPRPFLRALALLRKRRQLGSVGVTVDFFGVCRWFYDVSVERSVADLGLSDMVSFHGSIPHKQVSQQMEDADILLLLAQGQPLQLPNKLYEYVGVGRCILAFADHGGETELLLRHLGGHFVIDPAASDEAAAGMLHSALSAARRHAPEADPAIIETLRTDYQMDRLITALEQLIPTTGSGPAPRD